jgi:hypothetical protein
VQQHPYKEALPYILSVLQARTMAGLTTHVGKRKTHSNYMGNGIADHLASALAYGQPPSAIYFTGAHTHLSNGHGRTPPNLTSLTLLRP